MEYSAASQALAMAIGKTASEKIIFCWFFFWKASLIEVKPRRVKK